MPSPASEPGSREPASAVRGDVDVEAIGGAGEQAWSATPEWIAEHEKKSNAELHAEYQVLLNQLSDGSAPEIRKRFDEHAYETIQGEYVVTSMDAQDITGVMPLPDGNTARVILPRNEFPELYVLRDESNWIKRFCDDRVQKRAKQSPK